MEVKDFITAAGIVLTAILVIAGWFFARHKDQEHEKFKLRHSRREEMVKAFLKVDETLLITKGQIESEPKFVEYWLNLAGLMRLYGTKNENEALRDFAENFFGPNRSLDKANPALNRLKNNLTASVRGELGFEYL